jgi:Animal haem peroxidase
MTTRHGCFNFGEENPPRSTYHSQGKFGRLFPTLPAFAADTPTIREALNDIGRAGGIMDANDDMSDPITSITDPAKSLNNPDNPDMSAGFTFLGQFLDHDLTFDPTSSLERQQDPEAIANFRTPLFELDSVYGSGPNASPHLYDQTAQERKFYIEEIPNSATKTRDGSTKFDLPRNGQLTALIGDPRNDENLIISQLQLAFLKFHNAVVDFVQAEIPDLTTPGERFAEAQRLVRWHYQWIIVHEFLPKTCGQEVVDDVLHNGRKFYDWNNEPFIPVEFSVGVYRFGHSQVRPSYRANFGAFDGDEFFAFIFDDDPAFATSADPDDLRGGKRAERRFIDWQTFFDFGDGKVRSNKRIDTTLSSVLFDLLGIPGDEPQSLAQRNLRRSLALRVPSGQRVAKAMGVPELPREELADLQPHGLDTRTPLWFYVLREAEKLADGKRLGPVGGRIVAEVFIGVLEGDRHSYLRQDPEWTPSLPAADPGTFAMTDLLRFAGVVTTL